MGCGQGNHGTLHTTVDPLFVPLAGGAVAELTSPKLYVCNSPEVIGAQVPTFPRNMYKRAVGVLPGSAWTIRFYIWHLNQTSQKLYFALLGRAGSALAETEWAKKESETGISALALQNAGLCFAKAQLFGTLENWTDGPKQFDTTEQLIWTDGIAGGGVGSYNFVAAVIELRIKSSGNTLFEFRTVVSNDEGSWGSYSDQVVDYFEPGGGYHVRGAWDYATVSLHSTCGVLDACGLSHPREQFVIGDAAGGDTLAFPALDADMTPAGNKGLYGANLRYRFPVVNKCPEDRAVYAYLRARNTSDQGKFWGAARIVPFTQLGVPIIRYAGGPIYPVHNACSLNEGGPIIVPAETDPEVEYWLEFASGGSANLPVNFIGSLEQL